MSQSRRTQRKNNPRFRQQEKNWALGFGAAGLALIALIFLTEGSRRHAFGILLSILSGFVTLFYTFMPIFGDWGGFADSLASLIEFRFSGTDIGHPEYPSWAQKYRRLALGSFLGAAAGGVVYMLFRLVQ